MRDRNASPLGGKDRTKRREAALTMAQQTLRRRPTVGGSVTMPSAPSGPTPPAGGTGNGRGPGTSNRDGVELMAHAIHTRMAKAARDPHAGEANGRTPTRGAFTAPFPSVRAESRIHGGGEGTPEDSPRRRRNTKRLHGRARS